MGFQSANASKCGKAAYESARSKQWLTEIAWLVKKYSAGAVYQGRNQLIFSGGGNDVSSCCT